MDKILPTKTSSRAGRFKKKLVTENELKIEAPLIEARMAPFLELYSQNRISPSEFTASYIITILSLRYPGNWPGARRPMLSDSNSMNLPLDLFKFEPNVQKRLIDMRTLGDIFSNFALKSTPEAVNRALLFWASGNYGLELMFRIPTPQEVLYQQKQGRRVVSVLVDRKKISNFILGERDSLSFTMHDLIHADHFYFNNDCYQGQLGFYGLLDFCIREKHFENHLKSAHFESEFEYLISDMNAYAVHLLKCLKSALIFHHHEGQLFFHEWIAKLTKNIAEQSALLALNTPSYSSLHDEVLLNFISRWKQ